LLRLTLVISIMAAVLTLLSYADEFPEGANMKPAKDCFPFGGILEFHFHKSAKRGWDLCQRR